MPRGDRRGPAGRGAMTGRALGYCVGNDRPGYAVDAAPQGVGRGLRRGIGRGPGFGRGYGRGFGRGYGYSVGMDSAPVTQTENLDSKEVQSRETARLENLANSLANELEIVKNQIEKLKNND